MPMHDSLADSADVAANVPSQSMTGGTAVNGSALDMQGWDGAMFIINIGAITGAGTLDARIVRADNSGFTNATNVTSAALTQVTNANPNSVAIIDVFQPTQRYLRAVLTQGANTVIAGATVVRYRRNGVLPPASASPAQIIRSVNG